jgi:hypothetical protein
MPHTGPSMMKANVFFVVIVRNSAPILAQCGILKGYIKPAQVI